MQRSDGTLEELARLFAEKCHGRIDQRRKYTGEPYIVHPAAVVETVRSVPHTEAMLCAAWLHDVVEDTGVTLAEVERAFGAEVASLVEMLTDPSCPDDGNRERRKAIDREHTAQASREAKTIKLADLLDNTKTILERDPDFARVYMAEKELLLDSLKEGDPTLWKRAREQVDRYKDAL
ncbi:MAG TPA: hypothetical protein DIC53_06950 [Synergistaceae bacterium]|jgi:(p)ppGpp synthase/HD superfamily hydrolase|nr:hypothetical protein [Synergistaceae bacterium]